VAAYARHILHGGFYMDDWGNAALTHHPGGSATLADFKATNDERPVLIAYLPLTHLVFGEHMHFHLAWATVLAVAMALALYAVLRRLELPPVHCLLISALVLLFPWSDSTRLWATASLSSASIALYLAGVALALRAVRKGRSHVPALVLYGLSMMTYEVTLVAVALTGALYAVVAGWRRARRRWAADVALAVAAAIVVHLRTLHTQIPLSEQPAHAKAIVLQGLAILAAAVNPFGSAPARAPIALAVAAIVAAALVVHRRAREGDPLRASLGRWLGVAAGGAVAAAAGWLVFIPADPYYSPHPTGMENRTNVFAAIGVIVVLYAAAALAGILAARALRRPGSWWLAPVTGALVLGVGYVALLQRHERVWDRAFAAEMALLGQLKAVAPHPPPGATILTFGEPGYVAVGVPVFGASWDLNGAVRMQYDRSDLAGYPILPMARLSCGPRALRIGGAGYELAAPAPYGRAVLVDVPSGRTAQPRTRAACARAVRALRPGPLIGSA
jgi:hypothetical protein